MYVGGVFTSASDSTGTKQCNCVAKWNTVSNTWSALSGGLNGTVNTLAVSASDIYVGGLFITTGSYISKWNGSSWSSLTQNLLNNNE